MNILVTGGAGYIGTTLVPRLLRDHDVRVLDSFLYGGEGLLSVLRHNHFELTQGDIRERSDVETALDGIDTVIHLAAIVGDVACNADPDEAREVNGEAVRTVLMECVKAKVKRFILASTNSLYGKTEGPAAESDAINPLTVYAKSKARAEHLVRGWMPEMAVTILRFATVYGLSPRMRFDLLLNEFVLDGVADDHVVVYSPGSWRSHVHVHDLARAIEVVLWSEDAVRSKIFNVGGHNRTKKRIADYVARCTGAMIEYQERENDPRDYQVDFTRVGDLGFVPRYTPEDGITEVLSAIRCGMFPTLEKEWYANG